MLKLKKSENPIENETSTSISVKENKKHIFQENTEKCCRNRKIRKRCRHCYQKTNSRFS